MVRHSGHSAPCRQRFSGRLPDKNGGVGGSACTAGLRSGPVGQRIPLSGGAARPCHGPTEGVASRKPPPVAAPHVTTTRPGGTPHRTRARDCRPHPEAHGSPRSRPSPSDRQDPVVGTLMFEYCLEGTAGAARAGTLSLPHGQVKTPAFMPVGTHAVVRGLSAADVRRTGAQIILGNTYHLHLRPGEDLIRTMGGL